MVVGELRPKPQDRVDRVAAVVDMFILTAAVAGIQDREMMEALGFGKDMARPVAVVVADLPVLDNKATETQVVLVVQVLNF
jgi:uncharacterized membrane protein